MTKSTILEDVKRENILFCSSTWTVLLKRFFSLFFGCIYFNATSTIEFRKTKKNREFEVSFNSCATDFRFLRISSRGLAEGLVDFTNHRQKEIGFSGFCSSRSSSTSCSSDYWNAHLRQLWRRTILIGLVHLYFLYLFFLSREERINKNKELVLSILR